MKKSIYYPLLISGIAAILCACGTSNDEPASIAAPDVIQIEDSSETTDTVETAESTEVATDGVTSTVLDYVLSENVKATVDDGVALGYDDFDMANAGSEFTFDELTAFICKNEFGEPHTPEVSYDTLPRDNGDVLLIRYDGMDIYSPDDDSFSLFVIAGTPDNLHITYSVDSWCRNEVTISPEGIISSSGSSGAGDHGFDEGYIDNDGHYINIYKAEECFPGWIGELFEYFEMDAFSDNTIALANNFDMVGGDDDVVTIYKFGDELYGYISNPANAADLVTSAESDGLKWITQDELETLIADKEKAIP